MIKGGELNMERTRAYRREVRNKAIKRKKRVVDDIYAGYFFRCDGMYSKGHIGCGCGLCKNKWDPLFYEKKDKEYVRLCFKEING